MYGILICCNTWVHQQKVQESNDKFSNVAGEPTEGKMYFKVICSFKYNQTKGREFWTRWNSFSSVFLNLFFSLAGRAKLGHGLLSGEYSKPAPDPGDDPSASSEPRVGRDCICLSASCFSLMRASICLAKSCFKAIVLWHEPWNWPVLPIIIPQCGWDST